MFFLFHIIWLNLNFVLDVLAYTFHYSIIKVRSADLTAEE